MIEQRVTLRYGAQQIPAIVQAVQGDTGRDVIFELADYEIPTGATANYYIDKPDDTAIYNSAEVISSTEILAHLTEQALAEPGRNNGQVRILADGEVITSFDFVLEVEAFRGILRLQSETEVNIFDEALQAAAEDAIEEIQAQTPVVTGMQNSIAPSFSSSSTYAVGDYVMYNAQLYICTTAITTPEVWNASHWEQVPIANDVRDLKSTINDQLSYIGDVIQFRKKVFKGALYSADGTITPSDVRKIYCFQVNPGQVLSANGNFDMYGWFVDEPYIGSVAQSFSSASSFEAVTVPEGIKWLVFRTNYLSAVVTISPESRFDKDEEDISELQNITTTLQGDMIKAEKALKASALSLNGNYFNPDTTEWFNGIYSSQGTISGDYPYQYAYAKIIGAGDYVRVIKSSTFGDNALRVVLCDKDKNYIKYISGNLDGDYCAFTITEEDFNQAYYIIMLRNATQEFSPKLFYNTPACGDGWELLPNYGFDSDALYKKVLVCDGDSICAATPDNPKIGWSGWFGRFKMGYQMTGHNYGVGGGTITAELYYQDSTPRHWVCTSLDDIRSDYSDIDFLLLEGGTNDADVIGEFVGDVPPEKFGTWSENDYSGNYDNTTFCGAVDQMFYKAITYFPKAKIGFIIAMEMGRNESSIVNRKRYFEEIEKIAKKWHIPVLNLWDLSGVDARLSAFYDSTKTPQENADNGMFYLDGQHPTSWGYDRMQNKIDKWMRSF